jgi:lactoylglutathione lyase
LWVRDLESMREFYVTSFAAASGARYHNPKTGLTCYFISFGEGCRIELMHRPGVGAKAQGPVAGYAHVALSLGSREAVDQMVAALRQRGVAIQSGPRTTGDGYYEAVVLDPEGNEIEIAG